MTLVQNDDVVDAVTANRTNESFDIGILPGQARCDDHLVDTRAMSPPPVPIAVLPVRVTDQIAWGGVEWERFGQLLRNPGAGGVCGGVEVDNVVYARSSRQYGKNALLSAIAHELGHMLGSDHNDHDAVMASNLPAMTARDTNSEASSERR